MSLLRNLPFELQKSFRNRSVLKVISGLNNFNTHSVIQIAKAANQGGADLIDLACDPDLVLLAKNVSGLPICVSSVEPSLFPDAVRAGASMIEIGNFDSFYAQGVFFNASQVFELAKKTKALLPETFLSVTVPHTLPLDQQAQLAIDLIGVGANMIQTEGGTSSKPKSSGNFGLIEKAVPTLAAAQTISEALLKASCDIPVLCASGLSSITIPMALSVGASGVGVGSAVNRLTNEVEMIASVRTLRNSINTYQSHLELSLQ